MKFKFYLIFFLYSAIGIFLSEVKNSYNKVTPKIVNSKVNFQIDLKEHISILDEKVLYNLEFDNNEMKSVNYVKTLPNMNSQFFDVKVDSKDVKILKYEVVDQGKNKKLNLEFTNQLDNDQKHSKDGNVNINYSYKTRNPNFVEESRTKFLLKDVEFNSENNSSYPTRFSLEIKNIPNSLKMNRVLLGEEKFDTNIKDNLTKNRNLKNRITKKDIENSEKFTFDTKMGGNKSNSEKQLIIEFIPFDPAGISSTMTESKADNYSQIFSTTDKLNTIVNGIATNNTPSHKQNKNDNITESIIVLIVLLSLFMLFCCSFNIYPDSRALSLPKYV